MPTHRGRIRPATTLREIYGPKCIFNPRVSFSVYGWVPSDQAILDACTGPPLAMSGGLPTICSRAVATQQGLDLLARAGLPCELEPLTYQTRAEYLDLLADISSAGGQVALSHLHPPEEVERSSYWIDPNLLSQLNNKAHLAALVPAQALPSRWLIDTDEILDLKMSATSKPLVIKAASDLTSGGGVAVRICRSSHEFEAAHRYFESSQHVVVEEFLAITRNFCVNFGSIGRTAVYLGTAEQITTDTGKYVGNWLEPSDRFPARVIDLGRTIMQQAIAGGYRGVAGFDMALTDDGQVKVLDLNFRINGCTPALLVYETAANALRAPVGRVQFFRGADSFAHLSRLVSEAVAAGYFLPLSTYDPAASGEHRSRPAVSGVVLGQTRSEVEAKRLFLGTQGLLSTPSAAQQAVSRTILPAA